MCQKKKNKIWNKFCDGVNAVFNCIFEFLGGIVDIIDEILRM